MLRTVYELRRKNSEKSYDVVIKLTDLRKKKHPAQGGLSFPTGLRSGCPCAVQGPKFKILLPCSLFARSTGYICAKIHRQRCL